MTRTRLKPCNNSNCTTLSSSPFPFVSHLSSSLSSTSFIYVDEAAASTGLLLECVAVVALFPPTISQSSVTFGPNEYGQAELGLSKELRGMLPIVIFKESYSINDSQTVHIQHRPSHSGSVSCSLAKRTETGPVLRKTDFDGSSETGSAHKASNGVGAYRWLNRFLATDAGK
ncbi:hypothetical protein Bca101_050405 [Brassica carinata]